MSTIWTPGGEYVPKPQPAAERPPPAPAGEPSGAPGAGRQPSPEEVEAALAQARDDILAIPVLDHLIGHAMGLFELALLHLERPEEGKLDLAEASLAIDALAALVEGLGERLGKYQASLIQALAQLRLAFVQASGSG